jgi:DNA-binding MarR family transcriptional regulator
VLFKLILDPQAYVGAYGGKQGLPKNTRLKQTRLGKGVNMKAVAKTVEPADREARFDHIRPHYLEALTLVERLHRRLLDVIKDEFDRRGRADINSVQALLLYNIGDKELTAGELRTRGYYLGSNVSYNLKKLVEMGFLDHQRSRVDRRSVRIKLTQKGTEVRDIVDALYQKHVRTVEQVGGINADEFSTLNKALHRLERFWTDQILYRL